jgi:hypothetical protein
VKRPVESGHAIGSQECVFAAPGVQEDRGKALPIASRPRVVRDERAVLIHVRLNPRTPALVPGQTSDEDAGMDGSSIADEDAGMDAVAAAAIHACVLIGRL